MPAPAVTAEDESPIRYINISDSIVNETDDPLTRRSGDHYAHFASDSSCGSTFVLVNSFGWGGTCYNGFSAQSVLLGQAGTGNPQPTGSMYTSNDCSGSPTPVGIASGHLTGCTPNKGSESWQSTYLYSSC